MNKLHIKKIRCTPDKIRNCRKTGVGPVYYCFVLRSHYSTKCRLLLAFNKCSALISKYEVFLISKISVGRKWIALNQHKSECLYEQKRSSIWYKGKTFIPTLHSIISFLYLQFRICDINPSIFFLSNVCCKVLVYAQKLEWFPSPLQPHPSSSLVLMPWSAWHGRTLYFYYVRVCFRRRTSKSVVSLPVKTTRSNRAKSFILSYKFLFRSCVFGEHLTRVETRWIIFCGYSLKI